MHSLLQVLMLAAFLCSSGTIAEVLCNTELGTGIKFDDCKIVMDRLMPVEQVRSRKIFFVTAPSLAFPGQVQFVPRVETHGSCQISVYMQSNGEPIESSWRKFQIMMAVLARVCVASAGGVGGTYEEEKGFGFRLSHPDFTPGVATAGSLQPVVLLDSTATSRSRTPPPAYEPDSLSTGPAAPAAQQELDNKSSPFPPAKKQRPDPLIQGSTIPAAHQRLQAERPPRLGAAAQQLRANVPGPAPRPASRITPEDLRSALHNVQAKQLPRPAMPPQQVPSDTQQPPTAVAGSIRPLTVPQTQQALQPVEAAIETVNEIARGSPQLPAGGATASRSSTDSIVQAPSPRYQAAFSSFLKLATELFGSGGPQQPPRSGAGPSRAATGPPAGQELPRASAQNVLDRPPQLPADPPTPDLSSTGYSAPAALPPALTNPSQLDPLKAAAQRQHLQQFPASNLPLPGSPAPAVLPPASTGHSLQDRLREATQHARTQKGASMPQRLLAAKAAAAAPQQGLQPAPNLPAAVPALNPPAAALTLNPQAPALPPNEVSPFADVASAGPRRNPLRSTRKRVNAPK